MIIKAYYYQFPSPYGVSFILILNLFYIRKLATDVGFRLLTEYHSFLSSRKYSIYFLHFLCFRLLTEYHSFLSVFRYIITNIIIYHVSVSLRSIIHSYTKNVGQIVVELASFRLLTEYHSFLFCSFFII